MSKKLRLVAILFCAACLLVLVGCGQSSGSGSSDAGGTSFTNAEPEPEPAEALTFSNMVVETETREGFFGTRAASITISGMVTNKTGVPVNVDNFPMLVWGDDKEKVQMSQDKLLPEESCNVSWEEVVLIENSTLPEFWFMGPVEFIGLDECQSELNSQLQAYCADYAAADAEKQAEREARRQAEAEAAQKRDDEKATLEACVGMTATEARAVAEKTQYPPTFRDSVGVNVTDEVTSGSAAANANVTGVRVSDEGWFSSAEVVFTLDYLNPADQKKADDKAALNACAGKTAGEALEVAKTTDYPFTFIDSYGVDVTAGVTGGTDAVAAKVTKVSIDDGGFFSEKGVTFTLDYESPQSRAQREREEAERERSEAEAKRKREQARPSDESTPRSESKSSKYEYAYVRRGPNYDLYYLIDLDEMTVTYFGTESSPMVLPCHGDLSNGLTIDYVNDGFQEHLKFKRAGNDSVVILTDGNGFEWEYEKADVSKAEAVLASVS